MSDIGHIFDLYSDEIKLVEGKLLEIFHSDVLLIQAIGRHIVKSGGKRMRPLFLLLSAGMAGYDPGRHGDDHIKFASIIESIHTASLLHDDVVDGAEARRGEPSANALWNNQVVVLAGDFMYSNALRLTIGHRDHRINETLSSATTRMTQGELKQLERSHSVEITEEDYFDIISAKTGALISAACQIGGILSGCPDEQEQALASYGLKVGNSFQVADDILDYSADEEAFGKELGKDLDEGKVTLPLIYMLRHTSESERDEISALLDDGVTEDGLRRMQDLFRKYNALEETRRRAIALIEDAKRDLEVFPDCPERQHLHEIADYTLSRRK